MVKISRVCLDGAFFEIDSNGALTFKRASVGLQRMLTFTTVGNATFTKASFPGLTRIRVRAIGGGGGGAGANAATGEAISRAGGGGGAYSESVLDASALGTSESIVVGAGGARGPAGNNDGDDGGQSSFGGFVTAPGGRGSVASMATGTAPASASGGYGAPRGLGQIRIEGGNGGAAVRHGAQSAMSGFGGTAGGGYGAGGQGVGSDNGGADGSLYGGGGSGASSIGQNLSGGNGASGIVIIELFY